MRPVHRLTTLEAYQDDVYRDVARVYKPDRDNIPEGSICKITDLDTGKNALFALRGLPEGLKDHIMMDAYGRERLGIDHQCCHRFQFQKVGPLAAVKWACSAAEPGARIAAWIGVWSLFLGAAGIVIGIATLF